MIMIAKTVLKRVIGPRLLAVLQGRQNKSPREVFTEYYRSNFWGDADSRSGPGSNDAETKVLRERLPHLLRELGVRSMLDIPCGDFHWMSEVDLGDVAYTGADIVDPVIQKNNETYGSDRRTFRTLDLTEDALGTHDLILCRDCLFHLTMADGQKALKNIVRSGSGYLLSTTHVDVANNIDTETGGYRPIDLTKWPYNLPKPIDTIMERADAGFADVDKALGLWKIADLR